MRFIIIILLWLCSIGLLAQDAEPSNLQRDDLIRGYVLCDGRKVDAFYHKRNHKEVLVGCEDYSLTAVDTAVAGRIVVPQRVMGHDGQEYKVMGVSRHAFADCRWITEVVLPDSIHDIGDQSFMNCRSLRQIVLPPETKFLWPYAFRGCMNLMRVEVRAVTPPDSYNDVFDERTLRFATLVVPAEHAEAYRSAFVWNMFRYWVSDWD